MSEPEDRCPACGLPVATIVAFQAHHQAVAHDEQHVAALWSLLGVDYIALIAAEDRAEALERARERGWKLL